MWNVVVCPVCRVRSTGDDVVERESRVQFSRKAGLLAHTKKVCCLGRQPRDAKGEIHLDFPGCGRHTIGGDARGRETVKGCSSYKQKRSKQGGENNRTPATCMQRADGQRLVSECSKAGVRAAERAPKAFVLPPLIAQKWSACCY
jgi:hypothetical protein